MHSLTTFHPFMTMSQLIVVMLCQENGLNSIYRTLFSSRFFDMYSGHCKTDGSLSSISVAVKYRPQNRWTSFYERALLTVSRTCLEQEKLCKFQTRFCNTKNVCVFGVHWSQLFLSCIVGLKDQSLKQLESSYMYLQLELNNTMFPCFSLKLRSKSMYHSLFLQKHS